jgi:hypothetical protein
MKCKYTDKECSNRYHSHGTKKNGIYCRVVEWKRKMGICPYDKNIHSTIKSIRKAIKNKQQKTL